MSHLNFRYESNDMTHNEIKTLLIGVEPMTSRLTVVCSNQLS